MIDPEMMIALTAYCSSQRPEPINWPEAINWNGADFLAMTEKEDEHPVGKPVIAPDDSFGDFMKTINKLARDANRH